MWKMFSTRVIVVCLLAGCRPEIERNGQPGANAPGDAVICVNHVPVILRATRVLSKHWVDSDLIASAAVLCLNGMLTPPQ